MIAVVYTITKPYHSFIAPAIAVFYTVHLNTPLSLVISKSGYLKV